MTLRSYRDLTVWQKAMDMVAAVYQLTEELPAAEKFGLRSQLQRAAVSVPANIAEGYGRIRLGDYVHHLSIAQGSVAEAETLMALAVRLGFVSREKALEMWELMQEVGKMLRELIRTLELKRKSD